MEAIDFSWPLPVDISCNRSNPSKTVLYQRYVCDWHGNQTIFDIYRFKSLWCHFRGVSLFIDLLVHWPEKKREKLFYWINVIFEKFVLVSVVCNNYVFILLYFQTFFSYYDIKYYNIKFHVDKSYKDDSFILIFKLLILYI